MSSPEWSAKQMPQKLQICWPCEDRAQTRDNDNHAGKQFIVPSPKTVTVGRSVVGGGLALPARLLLNSEHALLCEQFWV